MKLLILGNTILAAGDITETTDSIHSSDAVYPKHVIVGYSIQDVTIPDGFETSRFEFIDGSVVQKTLPITEAQKLEAIAQTYVDVDGVHTDAVGNRATEYLEAESDARSYAAAGYSGTPGVSVSSYALYNPTGQTQTNQWAADAIIAAADAMRSAQISLRTKRFEHQAAMRASTTQLELDAAVAAWKLFISDTRAGLGI